MHHSLLLEALLITGALSSPLRPRQDVVTVQVTEIVKVTAGWNHHHWSDASTDALPAMTLSDGSSMVASSSPGIPNAPTSQQAPTSPMSGATVTVSSLPLLESIGTSATTSAVAAGQLPDNGPASIFPSASSIPVPAAGETVSATSLPITPSVGPNGNPVAPSATTQTYVDMCKSPSAVLPPLATPTDDSLADWFLYYHNIHRRNHSAPDMIWSTQLEKDAAQLFGEYATEGKSGHIMGINGDTYGQNLAGGQFWASGPAHNYGDYVVSNQQAANGSAAMWYHEGDNLSAAVWAEITAFTTNSHFTQMVSKVSTLLGCAVSQSGYTSANGYSNGYSVACNYGNNQLKDMPVTPGLCQPQVGP